MARWGLTDSDLTIISKDTLIKEKADLQHKIATDRSCGQCLTKEWKQDIEALDVLLKEIEEQEVADMYRVVFKHDDGTTDEVYTDSIAEVEEYQEDEDYAYVETLQEVAK